ncbi:MAG: N-6 DNA methylase, partial [Cellulosilyticaceae bacterium]
NDFVGLFDDYDVNSNKLGSTVAKRKADLASNGTAAIVCFPGIMYRSGAEQKIRKYLVDNNYVDCIIQLPSNLFFGTSIATCIMVMKKNKTDNKTMFIDASNECIKVTNNNKLTPNNIEPMAFGLMNVFPILIWIGLNPLNTLSMEICFLQLQEKVLKR